MSEIRVKNTNRDPLGYVDTKTLLKRFALPSIIAMLVGSLYNIVDQFFIGQTVGPLGNAATNIAFPFSIMCTSIGLLCGIGGSAAYNISMGRGERKEAAAYMGNAITCLLVLGLVLGGIAELFLKPLLIFFGSPSDVLPYAITYTGITALGFPFLILTIGGGHLIRADGRPTSSMLCNLSGALLNVLLDWIFVFHLNWGMSGAALATILGQYLSAGLVLWNLCHCKTEKLKKGDLKPNKEKISYLLSLGLSPCMNQLAMSVVQIAMNNSMKYYGGLSSYGQSIPIAASGVINKVNMLFMSFIIGISQGSQPIASYNYGAEQYGRVKKIYKEACLAGLCLACLAFLLFQLFPREITDIFGNGSEAYFRFAIRYFRIYLFFTFVNFAQPISSNFFTAIGKPKKGLVLALSRQVLFLLPMIIILPLFLGIDGIMYAGPVADAMAALITAYMVRREFKRPEYERAAQQAVD